MLDVTAHCYNKNLCAVRAEQENKKVEPRRRNSLPPQFRQAQFGTSHQPLGEMPRRLIAIVICARPVPAVMPRPSQQFSRTIRSAIASHRLAGALRRTLALTRLSGTTLLTALLRHNFAHLHALSITRERRPRNNGAARSRPGRHQDVSDVSAWVLPSQHTNAMLLNPWQVLIK
jgi:hypothetical protein